VPALVLLPCTFAASTLLTLLSEILKISKIAICKEQDSGKENIESSRIFY
jgi:hypothetical protein